MKPLISALLVTFVLPLLMAATPSLEIQELALRYQGDVSMRALCPNPDPTSCVNFVCAKLGTFGCDSQSKILQVVSACAGNTGTSCIETACQFIEPFGCTAADRVMAVARACKTNLDGNCLKSVCGHLSQFQCDEVQEVVTVLQACGGN